MHISFVKKIKADGTPCRKCADVERRLVADGIAAQIDEIVVADERDPGSPGMRLAALHRIDRAPFFLVHEENHPPRVFTVYFKFRKEILRQQATRSDELAELTELAADLDYV